MSAKILLIEDDQDLSSLLSELLTLDGYTVDNAYTGNDGLQKALATHWDAIILDIMLPEMDGLEVLRRLRPQCKSPVMMLTARGEELDRIIGFELGADDYLPKPFNPRELAARLKALLRRVQLDREPAEQPTSTPIFIENLCINMGAREASIDDRHVPLTQVEFDLLLVLVKNTGKVMTKEALYEMVLARKLSLYDRALDVHVSNLRKKLAESGLKIDPIKTIRGVGYLFSAVASKTANRHE